MLVDLRITNLVFMDVVIPDLGVHLHGKGSSALVNSSSANASLVLKDHIQKRWVRVDVIRRNNMPHWPFYSVPERKPEPTKSYVVDVPAPSVPPSPPVDVNTSSAVLAEIRDLLKIMTERQPSPEVLATHIALQNARLVGLPQPGAVHVAGLVDDAPKFIPSSIVPTNVDISLRAQASESDKPGMDDALASLRKLKGK
jgi:hypothetical protein